MKIAKMKCDGGCHGQIGIQVGPVQLEAAYALDKTLIGARLEVHRQRLGVSLTVFFGPFQFAGGLMLLNAPRPDAPA